MRLKPNRARTPSRAWMKTLILLAPLFAAPYAIAEIYTYDAQGRITSVTSDAGVVTYYCYNSAGNRTYVGPSSTCT